MEHACPPPHHLPRSRLPNWCASVKPTLAGNAIGKVKLAKQKQRGGVQGPAPGVSVKGKQVPCGFPKPFAVGWYRMAAARLGEYDTIYSGQNPHGRIKFMRVTSHDPTHPISAV